VHVRVGLLHLVQQHHAVRLASHRFGQHAAFAVAHVTGRRALEGGDGVRLLVLAHVDGDDVLLAAIQRLGQGQRGFGLAHPGSASKHEHAHGFSRVVEAGAGGLDAPRDHLQRMVLADDALAQALGQAQYVFDLVLDHAAHGNAGPILHHRGHGLFINADEYERMFALLRDQFVLQLAQLGQAGFAVIGLGQLAAQALDLFHQRQLVIPAPFHFVQAFAFTGQQGFDRGATADGVHADNGLALDNCQLGFQGLDTAPTVIHLGRGRMQADSDASTGRVDQADGLVWQLPRRDVAVGQAHRRFQRRIEDVHLMMVLHGFGNAAQHQERAGFIRFVHLHGLETPGQRRVFLDVLLVLGKGRRAYRAQGASGQRRLE